MQQVFAHCCLVGHWGEIFEFGVLDVPFLRFEVRAEVEHANLRVLLLLALSDLLLFCGLALGYHLLVVAQHGAGRLADG